MWIQQRHNSSLGLLRAAGALAALLGSCPGGIATDPPAHLIPVQRRLQDIVDDNVAISKDKSDLD